MAGFLMQASSAQSYEAAFLQPITPGRQSLTWRKPTGTAGAHGIWQVASQHMQRSLRSLPHGVTLSLMGRTLSPFLGAANANTDYYTNTMPTYSWSGVEHRAADNLKRKNYQLLVALRQACREPVVPIFWNPT